MFLKSVILSVRGCRLRWELKPSEESSDAAVSGEMAVRIILFEGEGKQGVFAVGIKLEI